MIRALTSLRRAPGAATLLFLSGVAACASSDALTAGGKAGFSLSFSAPAGTARASAGTTSELSASGVPITSNGHTLDLTSAAINVARVELHTVTKGAIDDEQCDSGHQCHLVVKAPLVVNLTPTGGVVTVTTDVVPAGTYREIGLRIASVRLVGTYDAKPFDVTVPVNVERELEFKPPVTIGGASDTTRNVTIQAPLTAWLRNTDGTLVDPSRLATDASLRAQVVARIRASLRAFRDDNRNDRDDDNEENEGRGSNG